MSRKLYNYTQNELVLLLAPDNSTEDGTAIAWPSIGQARVRECSGSLPDLEIENPDGPGDSVSVPCRGRSVPVSLEYGEVTGLPMAIPEVDGPGACGSGDVLVVSLIVAQALAERAAAEPGTGLDYYHQRGVVVASPDTGPSSAGLWASRDPDGKLVPVPLGIKAPSARLAAVRRLVIH